MGASQNQCIDFLVVKGANVSATIFSPPMNGIHYFRQLKQIWDKQDLSQSILVLSLSVLFHKLDFYRTNRTDNANLFILCFYCRSSTGKDHTDDWNRKSSFDFF